MSQRPLKAYLVEVIEETLLELKNTFSFDEFTKLKTPKDRVGYAATRLVPLGKGTARHVFSLDNKTVLKIALGDSGIEQNQAEAGAGDCSNVQGLFAKISRSAPDFSWIVMDRVKPLGDLDPQFQKVIGVADWDLFRTLTYWYALNVQKTKNIRQEEPENYKKVLKNPIVKQLIQVMLSCDLLPGDLSKGSSWGLTSTGKPVLIDYGLTKSVYMKYYYGQGHA